MLSRLLGVVGWARFVVCCLLLLNCSFACLFGVRCFVVRCLMFVVCCLLLVAGVCCVLCVVRGCSVFGGRCLL